MSEIARFTMNELLLVDFLFLVTIAYQLFTGNIVSSNLFHGTLTDGSKYFSPGRVQLLACSAFAAVICSAHMLSFETAGLSQNTGIGLLGLGNSIYLLEKSYMTHR